MLIVRNILISVLGIALYMVTFVMPVFRLVFFDWIALVIVMLPWILDVYGMKKEAELFPYLHRN